MSQSDINYIVEMLRTAIKRQDWESVIEALDYTTEFQEDPQFEEE